MHEDAMAQELCLRRLAGERQHLEGQVVGETDTVFIKFSNCHVQNSHPIGIHQRPLIILLFVAAAVFFGLSLVLMVFSLFFSVWEIQFSTTALTILLRDLEDKEVSGK